MATVSGRHIEAYGSLTPSICQWPAELVLLEVLWSVLRHVVS